MTPDETEKEIRTGLAAVLYVAAARADADDQQLARLRETIDSEGSLRYEETGNPDVMLAEVKAAMGPGWEPVGEWAKKLKEVLGE